MTAAAASDAVGAITVTPPFPISSDTITIRVETPFGSATHLTSASLSRTGNTFIVQQDVLVGCHEPQSTMILSQFQTGPLAAGVYSVVANITLAGPDCGDSSLTQTAAFTVSPDPAIPALDWRTLVLLSLVLAAIGLKRVFD